MFGGVLSFHVNVVPLGNPSTLPMLSLAFGSDPLSTVCSLAAGVFFVLIEDTVIFTVVSLTFPALSSARIVNVNSLLGVFTGSFSTSCFPALNLIEFVVLSYSK